MVTVAIAGGTGKIGHAITDALKESPRHKVIVLARKVCLRGQSVPGAQATVN